MTASELADRLGLSLRSINNYVHRINAKYNEIIISSNKGYLLNKEKAAGIIDSLPSSWIPSNFEERKKYILKKLLFSQQHPTMESLSQRLCVSYQTLKNEVTRLRNFLSEYELHLRIKEDKLSIIGSEKDKRKLILKLINEELEISSFSLDKIQELFLNVDLRLIKKSIISSLKKHGYFLDEFSLLNYIFHIAILIERKENNIQADDGQDAKKLKDIFLPHVLQIIEDVYIELSQEYHLSFSKDEFIDISLPMMTNAFSNKIDQLKIEQLADFVGYEIKDLLFEIVNEVRDTYAIDLKEGNFLVRFAFHLKNVMVRVTNNIPVKNNQLLKIKSGYPLIYVIAVFISNIINKKFDQKLSEDEIAYIALHIGVLIEEKKAYTEKLRCVVLAPEFHINNRELYKRLNNRFSESMIITKFLNSYDDLQSIEDFDLLLSTVELNPMEISPDIFSSYFQIDPFLSDTTSRLLFQRIEDLKQIKRREKIINQFKFFFKEDLFFVDFPFKSHVDVIEEICDRMIEKQYVDNSYKKEIYEHEDIAPSSYGNIAIPHPLTNKAKSSVIAISINRDPIDWLGNQVNIVFMLSLEEKNQALFKEIFDFIVKLIANNDSFEKIMNIKTYNQFIDLMVMKTPLQI